MQSPKKVDFGIWVLPVTTISLFSTTAKTAPFEILSPILTFKEEIFRSELLPGFH